ncbi:hypothetical protein QQZ08_007914 [Neonectria magnoliae]|uniref:SnoaL-like domain-containing protein n=1 Tax=Neonectria magnoliae TaxID=2732573 RepID=A0ABR1HX18_9HYPO
MDATTPVYTIDFTAKTDTYQSALTNLFSGKPEDTERDLSKLFTPNLTPRADNITRDFPTLVAHIRHLREILSKVTLTVTQFLRDGAQLAERHTSSTTLSNGTAWWAETFQFAEVAQDGQVSGIVETVSKLERPGDVVSDNS